MSLKSGIVDLPYGGGKGGIICDPREMSFREQEAISRGYVRAISQFVGPTKDIPAPDIFTNSQIMAWMMDQYSQMDEFSSPGFITGKPLDYIDRKSTRLNSSHVAISYAVYCL